jgi:predicted TIM-barrel fold metal-dependent hydrolase
MLVSTIGCGGYADNDPGGLRYVETHVHLVPVSSAGIQAAAEETVRFMDELGMIKCFVMPPPGSAEGGIPKDYEIFAAVARGNPDRFGFLAGGGSLNPMIQQAVLSGDVTDAMVEEFRSTAARIVDSGALGFGEMAAEYFSFNENHPYMSAPPDHPLFLTLADIAAEAGVPIDLHMEAVPSDGFPFPADRFSSRSSRNPQVLTGNIEPFKRLLAHNRDARVVWVHAGWDHTGAMTVELLRTLLRENPNLYFSIKDHEHSLGQNRILDENGNVKQEWLTLFEEFPDRFVFGSDNFYMPPGAPSDMPDSSGCSRLILDQLPMEIAREFAYQNVEKIYGIEIDGADTERTMQAQ